MVIFVEDIPRDGLDINEIFDVDPKDLVEKSSFLDPVSAEVRIIRSGDKIVVRGNVKTTIELECTRCLAPYSEKIDSSFDLVFFPEEVVTFEEEIELKEEDLNTLYYKEGIIDIDRIIIDQINLSIPFKPLCSEECKGLCPVCGKNLNEGPCGCEVKKSDPRINLIIENMRGK